MAMQAPKIHRNVSRSPAQASRVLRDGDGSSRFHITIDLLHEDRADDAGLLLFIHHHHPAFLTCVHEQTGGAQHRGIAVTTKLRDLELHEVLVWIRGGRHPRDLHICPIPDRGRCTCGQGEREDQRNDGTHVDNYTDPPSAGQTQPHLKTIISVLGTRMVPRGTCSVSGERAEEAGSSEAHGRQCRRLPHR